MTLCFYQECADTVTLFDKMGRDSLVLTYDNINKDEKQLIKIDSIHWEEFSKEVIALTPQKKIKNATTHTYLPNGKLLASIYHAFNEEVILRKNEYNMTGQLTKTITQDIWEYFYEETTFDYYPNGLLQSAATFRVPTSISASPTFLKRVVYTYTLY